VERSYVRRVMMRDRERERERVEEGEEKEGKMMKKNELLRTERAERGERVSIVRSFDLFIVRESSYQ
jgi:hypothetical protein